jgi:hypothetical protein
MAALGCRLPAERLAHIRMARISTGSKVTSMAKQAAEEKEKKGKKPGPPPGQEKPKRSRRAGGTPEAAAGRGGKERRKRRRPGRRRRRRSRYHGRRPTSVSRSLKSSTSKFLPLRTVRSQLKAALMQRHGTPGDDHGGVTVSAVAPSGLEIPARAQKPARAAKTSVTVFGRGVGCGVRDARRRAFSPPPARGSYGV